MSGYIEDTDIFLLNKLLGVEKMDVPEPLFKYTTLDTGIIILSTGRLRWSSPLHFNDLSEFQRMPHFEPSLDESISKLPEIITAIITGNKQVDENKLKNAPKILLKTVRTLINSGMEPDAAIRELINQYHGADEKMHKTLKATFESFRVNTARVFCLTTEPDNDVMWAHYAGNHTGIVLGFRHLPKLDTPFMATQPVTYSRQAPVAGSGIDFLLYGHTPELRKKILNAVCYTKSYRWEYEKEWRAITWRPEEKGKEYGDYKFFPEELESVCFGAKFDNSRLNEVKDIILAQYSNCSLYRMVVRTGKLLREAVD